MDTTRPSRFGILITTARLERAMTMQDLATATGIHRVSISRIEDGSFRSPRPDKLARIAEALDIPTGDLFAAAGYVTAEDLPTFGYYLRAKYGTDLTEDTIERIEKYVLRIARQEHGIDLNKPDRCTS